MSCWSFFVVVVVVVVECVFIAMLSRTRILLVGSRDQADLRFDNINHERVQANTE